MERNFFQDFKDSLGRLNCISSLPPELNELHNYSTVVDTVNTLHTRNNSCTVDENPLSQTQPIPNLSLITDLPEFDLNSSKLIKHCISSNDTILCRKYLSGKANFLFIDHKKQTYLHKAAKNGSLEICQILLAYTSINIHAKDTNFRSAIHLAALKGHVFVVQYLHRCGAYMHLKDKFNNTVLDYAIESKNTELICYVFEKSPSLTKGLGFDIQQLLKFHGINVNFNKKLIGDDKSKVKKLVEPVDLIGIHDFNVLGVLGKGSFGTVYLVELKENSKKFAMKMIQKEKVYKEYLESYLVTEKNIMKNINNPFIVKLHYAFQTPTYFCLVIDYCSRGTIAEMLSTEKCVPETRARTYLSEILLGIESLHKENIIYRDLKPENILIDETGHIKISDFGLSKEGIKDNHSALSFCGTAAYLAPEIIEKKGYGKCADWYAFGVLMFELLTGEVPNKLKHRINLAENTNTKKFRLPKYISPAGRNLLEGLLCNDVKKRIGYQGTSQIKSHEFFTGVDWENVSLKMVEMTIPKEKTIERVDSAEIFENSLNLKNLEGWSFIINN